MKSKVTRLISPAMSPPIHSRQHDKRQFDDKFHHEAKNDQQQDKREFDTIEEVVLGSRQHQIQILFMLKNDRGSVAVTYSIKVIDRLIEASGITKNNSQRQQNM